MSEEAKKEIDQLKGSKVFEPAELEKLEVQYDLHEGEVSKALDILLSHYDERKTNFGYLMTLATAAARAGEMQAAVGSYYQAYKFGGRSKLAKQALYQSAFMSYQFQDYDGAYRRFQEFMKVFPTSGLSRDAKWHLAWIRYLRGDFEGAYKSLEELKQVPRRGKKQVSSTDRVNYWMGMCLLKEKKYDEARGVFESLSNDQLLGYYAIASQYRLKKLESILPKKSKRGAGEATRRLSRFSMSETLMASDDSGFTPVSEESESEETLAVNALGHDGGGTTESNEEAPAEELSAEHPSETADNSEETEVKTSFSNPVLVKRFERARDLMILGLSDWAKWDLYDIERKTTNKEYLKTLMTEYETVDNYNRSSYIGQVSFGSQRAAYGMEGVRYLWEHTYPRAYASHVQKYSKRFDIPQELVWGIMRAESQYKKDVVSPVGALGLMQVMPNTGQKISSIIGEKDFRAESLLEPESAIKIGSRYLARLMKKFEGSVPLVAAGYNAGPHRVKSWLASFGELDVDEFIEHIPFLETRNYVKKVVSNFYIYNQLYNSKKDVLTPLADPNKVRILEPLSTRETWEDN
jgi:soluble lytic murein transglycosylase